jgi:hypothetical protein
MRRNVNNEVILRTNFKKAFLCLFFLLIAGIFWHGSCLAAKNNLDKQQQEQLVDLFDNVGRLCEAKYFKSGELTNDELITYGNVHSTGSKFAEHPDKNGKYRLPSSYVDQVAMQYFGKKVNHKSVPVYQYKKGYYIAHVADAGMNDRIEITSVESQGKDIYLVYASFFAVDDNELYSKKKALVKRIYSKGKSHFVMLEYQEDK